MNEAVRGWGEAARRRAAAFLRWWRDGLQAWLPASARGLLGERRYPLLLGLDGDVLTLTRVGDEGRERVGRYLLTPEGGRVRGAPPGVLARARELVLCLPEDQALVQRLRLPMAVEQNLRRVLGYQMDVSTPFSLDQVYYDGRVLARDRPGRTVDVELSVAPRAIVDEALAALQTVGLHPDRVAIDRAGADDCPDVNLLTTARRQRRFRLRRTLNLVLAVLALAQVAALAGLPLWDRHRTLRALEAELTVADREARAARELRAELERLSDGAAFLVERRRATPLVLSVLDEVTRLVPDDTWVSTLRLRDRRIELNGHSDASAALIPILDASPLFGNVRFLSPVTRDRLADDERFHLAADFEAEAAL